MLVNMSSYSTRMNINMAIVAMVKDQRRDNANVSISTQADTCANANDNNNNTNACTLFSVLHKGRPVAISIDAVTDKSGRV